jgi:hypothetical protein
MHAAQQLYASLGFKRIPPYRAVEFGETWFYERPIGEPLSLDDDQKSRRRPEPIGIRDL